LVFAIWLLPVKLLVSVFTLEIESIEEIEKIEGYGV
jgi:hypothetical protein